MHYCRELTAASWLLLLPMRGDGRYLTELPVQTLNSWKQTVTTGALCLRVEGKTEEREGLYDEREGSREHSGVVPLKGMSDIL